MNFLISVAFADDGTTLDSLFDQISLAIQQFGGLSWELRIASIILILIAVTKVSKLRPYWDKLGWVKGLVGPILGLAAGVLMLSKDGMLTLPGVMAYLFAGAGAIVLHELLDSLKQIPGVGPAYLAVISFFQGLLGKR